MENYKQRGVGEYILYYAIYIKFMNKLSKLFSSDKNRNSGCYGGKIGWKGCDETFWVIEMSFILIKVVGYTVYIFIKLIDFRNLNLSS